MAGALKPFAVEYRHKGKNRSLRLEAESFEDAEAQLASAYYNGEPQLVRLSVPLSNWFFGKR